MKVKGSPDVFPECSLDGSCCFVLAFPDACRWHNLKLFPGWELFFEFDVHLVLQLQTRGTTIGTTPLCLLWSKILISSLTNTSNCLKTVLLSPTQHPVAEPNAHKPYSISAGTRTFLKSSVSSTCPSTYLTSECKMSRQWILLPRAMGKLKLTRATMLGLGIPRGGSKLAIKSDSWVKRMNCVAWGSYLNRGKTIKWHACCHVLLKILDSSGTPSHKLLLRIQVFWNDTVPVSWCFVTFWMDTVPSHLKTEELNILEDEGMALWSSETSWNTNPVTKSHIPEDLNPQQCCKNLQACKPVLVQTIISLFPSTTDFIFRLRLHSYTLAECTSILRPPRNKFHMLTPLFTSAVIYPHPANFSILLSSHLESQFT